MKISLWLVAFVALLGVGWLAFLPYPYEIYRHAREATRYSAQWPISRADYSAVTGVVRARTGFYEIIDRIHVVSATRVEIGTLQRWKGPLAAHGQSFVLEKSASSWLIVEKAIWVSHNWPNKPDTANPAIASLFQAGRLSRGVADPGR